MVIYPKEYHMDGTIWDVDYIMHDGSTTLKKQFLQRIYNQFVALRTILGGRKCQKMSVSEMRKQMEQPENLMKVQNAVGWKAEQVEFIIFMAENEIPFVK